MIIGNREHFGIEVEIDHDYEPSSYVFGSMCLWVKGKVLGDIKEPACILGVSAGNLSQALKSLLEQLNHQLPKLDDVELYELIDKKIYTGGSYTDEDQVFYNYDFMTNGGESFDNTKSFIINDISRYKILFHDYEVEKTYYETVDKDEFHKVVEAFLEWHDSQRS